MDISVQKKLLKEVMAVESKALAERLEERLSRVAENRQSRGVVSEPKHEPRLPAPQKNCSVARMCQYLYKASGDTDRAISMATDDNKEFGDSWSKALSQSVFTGGGAVIAPNFSEEIIDGLYNRVALRQMEPDIVDLTGGTYTQPFIDTSATAYYVGENQNATVSEPTFGQLQLSEKKLVTMVPVSNDVLRNGGRRAEQSIMNDIFNKMAEKEDTTFLRSDGTQGTPRGLLYWADSSNKFNANATVNLANVTVDLGKLMLAVEDQKIYVNNGGFIMDNRSHNYLMTVRDGNGNFAFRDELLGGTLYGYKVRKTNNIPRNLGGGSSSEVYFGNFSDVKLGESLNMQVDVIKDAAYHDGSSVVSGASKDQSVIRVKSAHDLGCGRRGKEIAVAEAVNWGT